MKTDIFTPLNMEMAAILLVVGVILVLGVKFAGAGKWHEDAWSLSVSKGLQGICAVLIVLHHTAQMLIQASQMLGRPDESGPLAILEEVGVCFVGIFFFFSGYGLLQSLNKKEDYLKGFFRKRLPVILIPFYLVIVIFLAFYFFVGDDLGGATEWISYLLGWKLINSHMWYIVEIFILYIVFFLLFRFISKRGVALALMGIFVAALTIGSLLLGHGEYWFQGEWWFNTSFLFFIGMLIAQYEEPFKAFVKKCYIPLLIVIAAGTVILQRATAYMLENYSYWSETETSQAYGDKIRCLAVQLPFVIFFVLFVLLVTMKLQFKNKVMDFLGTISLELYLIHNLFLELFIRPDLVSIENSVLYTLAVLSCSILAAFVLHTIIGLIRRK